MSKEFSYTVEKKIATLGERGSYTLELRKVSWNGKPAKYDIRPWREDEDGEERMGKGISLSDEELGQLLTTLKGWSL